MKITKVYIHNFKGIKKRAIVDLNSAPVTVLNGPNGFGKTTIFDVIELCLRGRLARADNYKDITKNNADYEKPFYQNDKNEDVVLKIWMSDDRNQHIIIKRLNKDSEGRTDGSRRFRADAWHLFETYYTNNESGFDTAPDYTTMRSITQEQIDGLFLFEDDISLVDIFPLFHYLQQEENIYFLKKNEVEKRESLDFLFQTPRTSSDFDRSQNLASSLSSIKTALEQRIREIGQPIASKSEEPYTPLFSWRRESWDQKEPFDGVPVGALAGVQEGYVNLIGQLISLSKSFDNTEYVKSRAKNSIQELARSRYLLTTLVLYNFIMPDNLEKLRGQYDVNRKYLKYRADFTHLIVDESILSELGYSTAEIDGIRADFELNQKLRDQTTTLGELVSSLNQERNQLIAHYLELRTHQHDEIDTHCPLCNAKWHSLDALITSTNNKTKQFEELLDGQEKEWSDLLRKIANEATRPLQEKIDAYLNVPEHIVDNDLYAQIMQRVGNFSVATEQLKILQEQKFDISVFQISSSSNEADIDGLTESLRTRLQEFAQAIVVNEAKVKDGPLFREFYKADSSLIATEEALVQKLNYVTARYETNRLVTVQLLNERLEQVRRALAPAEQVRNQLQKAITDYKKEMIERVKIPFYVYSGKILQHFQQGYGIFVDVNPNNNRIRFLADGSSSHDAIHQLSTGQLAVVSIAFCLALNKVYKLPSPFKFLAIDDPVQTLDDINIYSLVDLIRHEFGDFQLLISTHDENIANFLKYKFEKFSMRVKKLNVQAAFYESQRSE